MKVVFVGQDRPYSSSVLAALARTHEIAGVVESAPAGGRGGALAASSAHAGVPYFRLDGDGHGEFARFLEARRPDALCVASCSQVLRDAALSAPRLGAVNLHPSLLPKLPGPNPWFWHYYFMEAVGGVTAHRMTARADAGPILRQERFSTPLGMEFEDLERQAGLAAGRCALKALEDLAAGAPGRPQAGGETFYARRVKRGERLIDWEGWPLERVWHVLKGTRAWLDALPPTGGWRRWSVGEKEPGPPAPAGRISRDGRGWYVGHRGGKIRLGLRYDWPEAVKALGRGVERTAKGWEGSARTELAG